MKKLEKLYLKNAAKLTNHQLRNVRGGSGGGSGSGGGGSDEATNGFYYCKCDEYESNFLLYATNVTDAYGQAMSRCPSYAPVSCKRYYE